ncbi:unnamed protein product [Heligmosomoides polygyrus]|uniref:Uncharacterized protein n=1 Tax=Heligmosomoides polygyrus TaxID=6339 RepID=A0A183GL97_HELPZ|nr:unnamed protein product [Heligmosomoides polygyrus]
MVAETQARMLYEENLEQLKPWVALEPLPALRVAVMSVRSDRTCDSEGSQSQQGGGKTPRARKKRSEARAATKDLEKLNVKER